MFRNRGLVCIVSDPVMSRLFLPAASSNIIRQPEQKVKEGRTIYLTINTIEVPLHIVPDVADNSSLRQAEARILASGFKLAEIQYIPGEKDWVYGVKYKGRQLSIGEKVPTGAVLTLMVGDGGALKADSLGVDAVGGTVEPVLSEDSAADESWF